MSAGRLIIRADASSAMGTGHVMRMIALGQAWQDRKGEVLFVGNASGLRDRLADEGFDHVDVPAPHPVPSDMETLLSLAAPDDWIALDGYHFDTMYQQKLRGSGLRTLVVDDVCDRQRYDADILLNQNPNADSFAYDTNNDCHRLLGTRFTMLRREFRKVDVAPVPEKATRILVVLGGSDPLDKTSECLDALKALNDPEMHVTVVAGAENNKVALLENQVRALCGPTQILVDVQSMSTVMREADLAVSAAGSTCWELCRFGVPIIAIQVADNQAGVCSCLHDLGAAVCLDEFAGAEDIRSELARLLPDRDKRQAMANAGTELVDGCGTMRIVNHLINRDISLCEAGDEDSRLLLDWRNHPKVRQRSFSQKPIDQASHERWFRRKLEDENCKIFIAKDRSGRPVGQFRFDIRGDQAYVSVNTDPDRLGQGFGTAMTLAARTWLHKTHPGIKAVALVKTDNPGSAAMFEKAGFTRMGTETDEHGEHARYES